MLLALLVAFFFAPASSVTLGCGFAHYTPFNVTPTGGSPETDADILVIVDTPGLILAGVLESDCSDLAFVYGLDKMGDDSTWLEFFQETPCDTDNTRYWVRIPSLPGGTSPDNLYVLHGCGVSWTNPKEQLWSVGRFLSMFKTGSCRTANGWAAATEMSDLYPILTSGTPGLETSPSDTHRHDVTGSTGMCGHTEFVDEHGSGSSTPVASPDHTHSFSRTSGSESNLLPGDSMMFTLCRNRFLDFTLSSIWPEILLLYSTSVFNSGTQTLSASSGHFPLYGTYTGMTLSYSDTHGHSLGTITSNTSPSSSESADAGDGTITGARSHAHALSGNSMSSATHVPRFVNVVPREITDGSVFSNAVMVETFNTGLFFLSEGVPPIGWEPHSWASVNDGRILRFVTSAPGATGGSSVHSHSVTLGTGWSQPSDSVEVDSGVGLSSATETHGHAAGGGASCRSEGNDVPSYRVNVIKWKDELATAVELPTVDFATFTCDGEAYDSPTVCESHAACVAPDTCSCLPGWCGNNCSVECCYGKLPTDPSVCSGRYCQGPNDCDCTRWHNDTAIPLPLEYGGNACDEILCFGKAVSEPDVCNDWGECIAPNNCLCDEIDPPELPNPFGGPGCDVPECSGYLQGDPISCSGHGYCEYLDGYGVTQCACMKNPITGEDLPVEGEWMGVIGPWVWDGVRCQNVEMNNGVQSVVLGVAVLVFGLMLLV